MFSGHEEEAAVALGGLQGLLRQQEYEFQRVFAELHLLVMQIETMCSTPPVTRDMAEAIQGAAGNLKFDLREAREHAQAALRCLEDLEARLLNLRSSGGREWWSV